MLLAGVSAALATLRARAENASAPALRLAPRSAHVGINLAGIAYWTTQFPFADLVKNSDGWSLRERGGAGGAKPVLNADGYPASLAPGQRAVLAVAWSDTRYATGEYVVRWDGDGEIGFPGVAAKVTSRAPGRAVVDVRENRGQLWVSIERTNPADPLRRLRFLWPGTESTHEAQPFNPEFLAKLAPFQTLRFMDWGATNGSPVAHWSERAQPGELTYASPRGVPVESMIALANALHADPWFCIPHQADDDYVRRFAALVQERLEPGLVATIEYSNEVWNGGFAQARWALAQSQRLGLPSPSGQASAFYAERVLNIAAIFADVFGAAQRKRWSVVVAGQAAWTQFAANALAWKDTAARVDALAIAPYFRAAAAADPKQVDATLALDADAIHAQMLASIDGEVRSRIAENAKLAQRHRLRLVGYEGGAHDTSSYFPADKQDRMTAFFASAHRHPRMRDVYRRYYETWIEAGGAVLNQYNDIGRWSKWGFWSVLEHVTQDSASAPKYQALLETIAAHPAP